MIEGTLVNRSRTDLVTRAIETNCTHILWVDSDMKFPQDSLLRLLAHKKEIVGANYSHRRFPLKHVAYKTVSRERAIDHVICRTTAESTGLEEVDALGMGLMLVQTRVYLGLTEPWFAITPAWGEDIFFCLKARETKGIPTWVDHDLSKEVVHFGKMGYTFEDAERWAVEHPGEPPIEAAVSAA
jgi:acyl CoA:acetate/3-ketoacid CoA transferase alpha subunit